MASYRHTELHQDPLPVGVILLRDTVVEELIDTSPLFPRDFCFRIITGGKEYYYSAASDEERKQWIQGIKNATNISKLWS